MLDSTLIVFIVTSLVLIASPGQDMVLVISRSIGINTRAGIVTAAGVATGLLGHTVLVAMGLGALLQTSELAFSIMKYVGAAYLLYIGYKTLKAPPIEIDEDPGAQGTLKSCFIAGALSNVTNPKIAIFFFAYLPQFVSADNANPTMTLLALGSTFAMLSFLVKTPVGYVAGRLSGWFKANKNAQRWLNRICGGALALLAVRLATAATPGQ
ncbi:LysE family translocator [Pontibacterium sp.]|uniref:LysE family translocator n=1 Tax=Pontibacterium sp. TaxID=2036026 RepID=UPI003510F3DD